MLNYSFELPLLLQILIAFLLGALVGWEREHHGREAGIRTFGAIALGACVYGLISIHGANYINHTAMMGLFEPSRIASNVVVGVGFLGAGLIFRDQTNYVAGLTTAATLWCTASIGLAVAFNMYSTAVLTTLILLLVLWLPKMSWWKLVSAKKRG